MNQQALFDSLRFARFGLGLIPKPTSNKKRFTCKNEQDAKRAIKYIDFLKAFGFKEELCDNAEYRRLRFKHGTKNEMTISYRVCQDGRIRDVSLVGDYWDWASFNH